ncbi:hypothetical protein [Nonomuraea sp. NPDC049725]|uniref:hypothetical protein n=1 Tax=Nonomuraea sp. NPDC049725 TaxID=3154508 RepID=UPI00342F2F02
MIAIVAVLGTVLALAALGLGLGVRVVKHERATPPEQAPEAAPEEPPALPARPELTPDSVPGQRLPTERSVAR